MAESAKKPEETKTPPPRTFLCVVDQTAEFGPALRYACQRAKNTGGRMALLYVIEPAEFQHWLGVENRMREEARANAEEMIRVIANVVQQRTGHIPVVYIREGKAQEQLIKLIDEERHISLLVLGAATGTEGPGPLVTYLTQKISGKLRVPITIVPGYLNDEQIDAIT
ncbi:MAG: universal stress protein [Rhodospirillales bacterium]|nr:universal stress protein [Rhodospirillales bacterium]